MISNTMFLNLPALIAFFLTDELWGQNLAWLHQISNIATALAYYFVSLLIIYIIHQRKDISFTPFLWLLACFLIGCGTSYVIGWESISHPDSLLWGYWDGLTAIIALISAIGMLFTVSQILNFPSSQQLQDINEKLNQEISQFQLLDQKIRSLNAQLEKKIEERTSELKQVNQRLTAEIEERKQIASTLDRQVQLEQLISYFSHRFINVAPAELDSTIDEALNSISEFVGIDRSYLFLFRKHNDKFQVAQKWSKVLCPLKKGIYKPYDKLTETALSEPPLTASITVPKFSNLSDWGEKIESKLPWIMTNIKGNIIVNLPKIDSLPLEAAQDRWYLKTNNIKSLLIVPMFYGAAVKGILALEAVNQEIIWTERDIQLLKLTGEIISGAVERCRQATELANRTEQLEASNQELEKFAYIVSHDLSEPLRSISGFSYLLQEEYESQLDREAQEYLEFINDGSARMQQLIEDLLAFSRVGSQNLILTLIDCEQVIQEVISNLQAAIIENKVEIYYDKLPKIMADRTKFVQLWQNLIANAIKFRNPHLRPQINISATQKSQELVFTIQDNGIGIESKYTEEIFAVFRRLHNRKQYSGTGIGLAICRRIVELHGGRISVKSSLGKGATFYICLPIRSQNSA